MNKKITIDVELITPDVAKRYLELNTSNRVICKATVIRYATDMTNGNWDSGTTETLKIAWNNVIIDGQHRLLAIVKSGKSMYMHVAKGLNPDVILVIDSGKKRSAGDAFKLNGVPNYNRVSAIIAFRESCKNLTGSEGYSRYKLSTSFLYNIYIENIDYWDSLASDVGLLYHAFSKVLSPSTLGGCMAYFDLIDKESSREFMGQLCSGVGVQNATIHLLRTTLINDKISSRKISTTVRTILIIKTWNCYRKNQVLKQLKFNRDSEKFPVAI